jgi:L-lactate permease
MSSETLGLDNVKTYAGAWGKGWDVVVVLLPIVFLLVVTVVKPVQLKTRISLPLSAAMLYVIRLAYLGLDPNFTNAAVLYGFLDTLIPLGIITGAICLYEAMQATEVSYCASHE